MGGANAKYNHNGGIFIQLENSAYFGGQEVAGMIHMNIISPMAPSTLYLIFKGKEQTHWEESRTISEQDVNGNSTSRTVVDYYTGKSRIVNFQYPIYRWDYPLPSGGYSLPFRFILPSNVPGSFHYHGRHRLQVPRKAHQCKPRKTQIQTPHISSPGKFRLQGQYKSQ